MPCLQIIVVSTRPGRKGPAVASWFEQQARAHGAFDVEVVDLAAVALPLFDEPEHPRLRKYQHAHTEAWSETVSRGDAFVFVTPGVQLQHAAEPAQCASTTCRSEWAYKPAAFVSYGGISGGLRGVQTAKLGAHHAQGRADRRSRRHPACSRRVSTPSGAFTSDAKLDASADERCSRNSRAGSRPCAC